MDNLTDLKRRILAELEEAGEEDVAALINSFAKRRGAADEIDQRSTRLASLLHSNFLEISRSRDKVSLRWAPLPQEESQALVSDLRSCFQWSDRDHLWNWRKDRPRAEAILTNAGLVEARKILSEDGWPDSRGQTAEPQ